MRVHSTVSNLRRLHESESIGRNFDDIGADTVLPSRL
jgi:hypothetical protein